MKTAQDVLTKALALISSPAAWTRGALARDEAGEVVWPNDPKATCWCPQGAISLAADGDGELARQARYALQDNIDPTRPMPLSIPMWNDHGGTTHENVVHAMQRAIEAQSA